MADDERALSIARKRRGVIRASITRLDTRLTELEGKDTLTMADESSELEGKDTLIMADESSAQNILQKLSSLDADFRSHHLAVVDLIAEDAIEGEQVDRDRHDDRVNDLTTRIQQLCAQATGAPAASATSEVSPYKFLSKRLRHIEAKVMHVVDAIDSLPPESGSDTCLLRQHEERLGVLETELQDASRGILSLEHDDANLSEQESTISQSLFDIRLRIKRLLSHPVKTASPPVEGEGGVKLPKLSVPPFDGNVVNWRSFWEQFRVSVHDKPKLSNVEKLAYLKHALNDGSARHVVEGLSGSGDHYKETVDCLRKRYDRPRLIHKAHVRAILETPPLKDSNGRESCVESHGART